MAERALRRVNDAVSVIFVSVAVVLLLVIVGVVFANVFARDLLSSAIHWSGEVSVFALLWMTFLGAAVGYRRKMFPAFTALVAWLPDRVARWIRLLVVAANVVAAGLLVVVGLRFAQASWAQQSPVLGVSLGMVYLAIPISGLAIALMSFEFAIDVIRGEPENIPGLATDSLAEDGS